MLHHTIVSIAFFANMILPRFASLFLLALLVSVSSLAASANTSSLNEEVMNHQKLTLADGNDGVDNQYIVTFEDGVDVVQYLLDLSANATAAPQQAAGGSNIFNTEEDSLLDHLLFPIQSCMVGAIMGDLTTKDLLELLNSEKVISIEQDRFVEPHMRQAFAPWHLDKLDNPTKQLDWNYDYQYEGSEVDVFVIDTGLRLDHIEFAGRASCGFNAFEGEDGCTDVINHGTHIASTIGGITYGAAKKVNLIGVKVLGGVDGSMGTNSNVIRALEYVVEEKTKSPDNRPMVANLALGTSTSLAMNQAIDKTVEAGVVVVASAGNDDMDACLTSPASAERAITVGSIDPTNQKSIFSNHGPCVSIFAPGTDVMAASSGSTFTARTMSGTSRSAALVSAIAALYLERDPELTPGELWSAMESNAAADLISQAGVSSPNLVVSTLMLNILGTRTESQGSGMCKPFFAPCSEDGECCWNCFFFGFCFFF